MSVNWLAVIVAVVALAAWYGTRGASMIDPKEAKQLVTRGALLVDVRTVAEFNAGHIEGALNLPLQDLEKRIDEIGDRDHDVVLYCHSGNRSGQAKSYLEQQGFKNVHNLGGMNRWH